jgi:hypothetical protein
VKAQRDIEETRTGSEEHILVGLNISNKMEETDTSERDIESVTG